MAMMRAYLALALLAVAAAQNATNATVGANETGTLGEQTPNMGKQPVSYLSIYACGGTDRTDDDALFF